MKQTRLRTQQVHAGTWLNIGSTISAEIASRYSFDWLLLDMEHGHGNEATLLQQLQATSASNAAMIVRVGHVDASLIARALDWGADGIMLPQVGTVEKAKACLNHMLYPPNGSRGYTSSARTFGYGIEPMRLEERPVPFFMAQIETWQGVQNVQEIAALPGVDVLFIGPTDLKADLAAFAPDTVHLDQCIANIIAAAQAHGKQTGIVLKNKEELIKYRDMGVQFLSYGSDLSFLKEGLKTAMGYFQGK